MTKDLPSYIKLQKENQELKAKLNLAVEALEKIRKFELTTLPVNGLYIEIIHKTLEQMRGEG